MKTKQQKMAEILVQMNLYENNKILQPKLANVFEDKMNKLQVKFFKLSKEIKNEKK